MGRAPAKVSDVFLRKRRNGEVGSRNIDALALAKLTPDDHTADDALRRRLLDFKIYRPVVDEDRLSPLHLIGKRLVVDIYAVLVPLPLVKE